MYPSMVNENFVITILVDGNCLGLGLPGVVRPQLLAQVYATRPQDPSGPP